MLFSLYNELYVEPLSNLGVYVYERPPLISNGGVSSMPTLGYHVSNHMSAGRAVASDV